MHLDHYQTTYVINENLHIPIPVLPVLYFDGSVITWLGGRRGGGVDSSSSRADTQTDRPRTSLGVDVLELRITKETTTIKSFLSQKYGKRGAHLNIKCSVKCCAQYGNDVTDNQRIIFGDSVDKVIFIYCCDRILTWKHVTVGKRTVMPLSMTSE